MEHGRRAVRPARHARAARREGRPERAEHTGHEEEAYHERELRVWHVARRRSAARREGRGGRRRTLLTFPRGTVTVVLGLRTPAPQSTTQRINRCLRTRRV